MATSKNDFECHGGKVREKVHRTRGKHDAMLMMINPVTSEPYTYQEMIAALEQWLIDRPAEEALIQHQLEQLQTRADENAQRVFTLSRRGKSKEEALQRLHKEVFSQAEVLMKLLFRPAWNASVAAGIVTVRQFVEFLGKDLLYINLPESTREHLRGVMNTVLLPVMGEMHLRDLTAENQKKLIRKINSNLRKSGAEASKCGYARRAYQELFKAMEEYNAPANGCARTLSDMISIAKSKNMSLPSSLRPNHLDEAQRTALFALPVTETADLAVLVWVALIYCGMSLNEIGTARFGDIQVLETKLEHCYTLLVSRVMRKKGTRLSTLRVRNDEFPFKAFRVIVMYPWTAEILERCAAALRAQSLSDDALANLRFSEIIDGALLAPNEMDARIRAHMKRAGIADIAVPRTGGDGAVTKGDIRVAVSWIESDARYVAEALCGINTIMQHAMFGIAATETDETAYLALLSPEYALARYHHLRRFTPFQNQDSDAANAAMQLCVKNESDAPQTLTITGDYGINLFWRETLK
ncbi:MAG: hypothetical protein RR951_08380 [Ruthenibacterium sp.]